MNNDTKQQLYTLAQNAELAYFRIAQVRQGLLDRSFYYEWRQLIEASSALDSVQSRLVEMLSSWEES